MTPRASRFTTVLAFSAIAAMVVRLPAEPIIFGQPEIIDGDTIIVAGVRIRLYGIDAPEGDQRCLDGMGQVFKCGSLATDALGDIIAGEPVSCTPVDRDIYGRTVAVCSARERDLGEEMVLLGFAVDFKRYSRGRYDAAEREAKAARRGLWAGYWQRPEDWRRDHRRNER